VAEAATELVCPRCGRGHAAGDRFCVDCRVPLTYASGEHDEPVSERRRLARKVKPQLAEGRLIRVAGARNQAEAEFIQSLLLEEGVPSVLRRSAGFDVPDFLAAGPRDILVPESGVATAREVLLQAELISPVPSRTTVAPGRLALGLLAALAIGAVIVWAALQLAG
jgi:Putative prokaryotic signal transducing protein